jgi:hypothetical protein
MTERTGRCLCGQVQFKITAEPLRTRICWCKDCQHLAANGTVNVVISADALEFAGTVTPYQRTTDSGNTSTRWFCATCGSHLFGMISAFPELRTVRAGNLDDPSSVQPSTNIWTTSAPTWACMDESLEQFERQPPVPPPKPPTVCLEG